MAAPLTAPNAPKQGVTTGSSVSAGTLFSATDADGDSFTQYQFWDNGSGGGHFTVNGLTQASSTQITVSAADLANVQYVAGAPATSETLYVRAMAGGELSAWQSWDMYTLRTTNTAAVLSAPDKNALQNEWWRLSDLVTVSDSNGDTMWRFEIKDNNTAPSSAYVWFNGVSYTAGGTISVEASDLSAAWLRGGANLGTDTIEVRAFDGYEWSAWESFDLRTRVPNRVPVVTPTQGTQGVVVGNSVLASSLFGYSDADSDPATLYQFWDNGAGGGNFKVGANVQGAGAAIEVQAANLASVTYAAGAGQGAELVYVRAYDGEAWSGWTSWTMQTLRATNVASVADAPNKNALVNEYHALSTFVKVTDGDSDPIVRFQIRDLTSTAGSGAIWANGALQAQGADVTVEGGNLAGAWVRGGANLGIDAMEIRVFDGYEWSAWDAFDLRTRVPDRAPVVTPTQGTQGVVVGNAVAASTLFGYSDADADPATLYQFWDNGAGGGNFKVGANVQGAGTAIEVQAANLATVTYAAGGAAGSETVYVRAYDGELWSGWTSWTMQTLRATNVASVVDAPNKNALQNEWWRLSDFVRVSDFDGDPIVRFEVRDNTSAAGSAVLWANGVTQAQGATASVESNTLSGTWVRGGANLGTDQMEIRVFDGYEWSAWDAFDLRTRVPNRAPVVTPTQGTQGVVVGNSVLASSLFGYSDADSDPATKYQFWDNVSGGGNFKVGSAVQSAGTTIEVLAGALGTVTYAAGGGQGSETVYARAFDGELWSDWKSWTMQTLRATNVASVVDAPNKNTLVNEYQALSTFVKVTDGDSDPVVRFQIRDLTNTAGSGTIWANGALQAQGADVTVEGGNLAGAWVRGGANLGTDQMEIRVFDGYEWSAWDAFDLRTRVPNRAPVVTPTAALHGLEVGTTVAASTLFGYQDADADAAVKYEFWDNIAGGGSFFVDGTEQPAGRSIEVAAGGLSAVTFVAGATDGVERVYVRAYDGEAWSEWRDWRMETFTPERYVEHPGTSDGEAVFTSETDHIYFGLAGDDVFQASNGSPIFMGGTGADTYTVGAGAVVEIFENGNSAGDRLNFELTFFDDLFGVIVDGRHLVLFDGSGERGVGIIDWQVAENRIESFNLGVFGLYDYDSFVALVAGLPSATWEDIDSSTVQVNESIEFYRQRELEFRHRAPVLTPTGVHQQLNHTYLANSFFQASDPDGDPVVWFELTDLNPGGGFLTLNGVVQDPGVTVQVFSALSLNQLTYTTGGVGSTDTLRVRASDGSNWSEPLDIPIAPFNFPPALEEYRPALVIEGHEKPIHLLVSASDFEGAPLTYELTDVGAGVGSGRLLLDGVEYAADTPLVIGQFDLFRVRYVGGTPGQTDVLRARVFDGFDWSDTLDVQISPLENQLPFLTVTNGTVRAKATAGGANEQMALSARVAAGDNDFVSLPLYRFTDNGVGGGCLVLGGVVQAEQTPIEVAESHLNLAIGDLFYRAGDAPGSETITAQVFDGIDWSAPFTFTMTTTQNIAPAMTATDRAVGVGGIPPPQVMASDLFKALDLDGDSLLFHIRAPNSAPGTGLGGFGQAGIAQDGDPRVWEVGSLADFGFFVFEQNSAEYTISARAWDGVDWSDWVDSRLITAGPPYAPVVTGTDRYADVGRGIELGALFSWMDPDSFALNRVEISVPGGLTYSGDSLTPPTGTDPKTYLAREVFARDAELWTTAPGQYVVSVRVNDFADNWSEWADATLTVVDSPLEVSLGTTPQTFRDWIGGIDTVDEYRFTLASAAEFKMNIAPQFSGFPAQVSLLDGAGNALPSTVFAGGLTDGPFSASADLAPGTYTLRLQHMPGSSMRGDPYSLTLAAS